MKIEDGTGKGYEAAVDDDNRLKTASRSSADISFHAKDDGDAYIFSTGAFISITTTNTETGILYVKNSSTSRNLIIHSIRTSGNQVQKIIVYKNPTGGTLISNASAGNKINTNLSSSNTADALTYKGADAVTCTGGTAMALNVNSAGNSLLTYDDAIILGPLNSIAVTMEVPSAGIVAASVLGYFE